MRPTAGNRDSVGEADSNVSPAPGEPSLAKASAKTCAGYVVFVYRCARCWSPLDLFEAPAFDALSGQATCDGCVRAQRHSRGRA